MTKAIQIGDRVRLNAAGIAAVYGGTDAAQADIERENATPFTVLRRFYSKRDGCSFVQLKDNAALCATLDVRLAHVAKAEG